jgi:signal transduction histidine kinase/DNA-binding response OmpR family regulator
MNRKRSTQAPLTTDSPHTELHWATAQRMADMGTWEFDFASEKLWWSTGLYRINELEPGSPLPNFEATLQAIHDDDRAAVISGTERAIQGDGVFGWEYRQTMPSGQMRYRVTHGEVIRAADGTPLRLIGTVQDITKRRVAELALQRGNAVMLAQQEAGVDGILVVDEKMAIICINQMFKDMWRVPSELSAKLKDQEVLAWAVGQTANPDAFYARVQELYRDPRAAGRDEVLLKDGRVFDRYSAPVLSPDGEIFGRVWYFRDITPLKLAHSELQAAMAQAERESQAKSLFLANMSHELRTPLNAIIGYSEMLFEDAQDNGQSEVAADLQKIRGAGRHLLALINDILDLSKIEAGKMEVSLEPVLVAELMRDLIDTITPSATKRKNQLTVTLGAELTTMVTDAQKLRQALLNLLSNANKFTNTGTINLTVDLVANGMIRFRVADNGIGISPEQQARLFQDFVQADASTTRLYGGTGLGLAITRRLCKLLGGDVSVESNEGCGAVFTILLPVSLADLPLEAGEKPSSEPALEPTPMAAGAGSTRRILVVDDDVQAAELICRPLVRAGFEVRRADTGESALRQARQWKPDAITLDVLMPGIDGWMVLAALKQAPDLAEIPVIMLTMVDEKSRAYALGATDYMLKPVDRERLIDTLHELPRPLERRPLLLVGAELAGIGGLSEVLALEGFALIHATTPEQARVLLRDLVPVGILLDIDTDDHNGVALARAWRQEPRLKNVPIAALGPTVLESASRDWLVVSAARALAASNLPLASA